MAVCRCGFTGFFPCCVDVSLSSWRKRPLKDCCSYALLAAVRCPFKVVQVDHCGIDVAMP